MAGFEKWSSRRVVRATRRIEEFKRNDAGSGAPPRGSFMGKLALTTSTITARSGATLGSGTATLQVCKGTAITSLSITVTVYNTTLGTIASGVYIQVKLLDGQWTADVADCP